MKVFVDTSALVALLVDKEEFHSKVASQYKDFSLDEVFTLDSDFKKMRVKTSS